MHNYMPKKQYARKPKAYRRNKAPYRLKKRNTMTLYNKTPLKDHTPISPRYRNKMEVGITFTSPATATATSGYLDIFNQMLSSGIVTTSGWTSFALVPNTIASATVSPNGFSKLNTLYGSYRVISSRILVEVIPGNASSDVGMMVLAPYRFGQTQPTDTETAMALPYNRNGLYGQGRKNILSMGINHSRVLGMTPTQYNNELETAQTGSLGPASEYIATRLYYQYIGASCGICYWRLKISYNVEWFDPVGNLGID